MIEYNMEELDDFAVNMEKVAVRMLVNELIKKGQEEAFTERTIIQSIAIALYLPDKQNIESVENLRTAIAGQGRKFPDGQLSTQTLGDLCRSVLDIGIETFPEDLPF